MRPVSKDGKIQVIFSEPHSENWEMKVFSDLKDANLFFKEMDKLGKNVELWFYNSLAGIMRLADERINW